MEKAARRRHQVPAFGEWNYYYHYDEPVGAATPPALAMAAYCYGTATPEPEPEEACSDVWFRYSPPPRKPATPAAKKPARRTDAASSLEKKAGRRARAASEVAGGVGGLARAHRVVRPVDEDLYQVPPPEFASSRRKPRRRSLWMGCLGCVA